MTFQAIIFVIRSGNYCILPCIPNRKRFKLSFTTDVFYLYRFGVYFCVSGFGKNNDAFSPSVLFHFESATVLQQLNSQELLF